MLKYFIAYSELYFTHLEKGNKCLLHSLLKTQWDIACKVQISKWYAEGA